AMRMVCGSETTTNASNLCLRADADRRSAAEARACSSRALTIVVVCGRKPTTKERSMRRLLTFLVVAAPTLAFASPEVAAVLKVQEEFAASWNKGDYKAMAAVFADDADRINAAGRVAKGKAEIEKLYQEEQTGKMKGTHFASECNDGVRLLKPDVAVVTCSFEVTEMKGPDG